MISSDIFKDFRHNGNGSIHQELAYYLKHKIEAGALKPGDALPPLRKLSELLDVNFFSVKLATDALVDWGLLNKQHGRGMFIAPAGTCISKVGIYSCARYMPTRDLSFYTVLQNLVCSELTRRGVGYTVYNSHEEIQEAILTGGLQALIGIYVDDQDKKWFLKLPVKKVNMMRDLMFDFGSIARYLAEKKCRRIAVLVPAAYPSGNPSFLIAGLKACGVRIMPRNIRAIEPDEWKTGTWGEVGYRTVRELLAAAPEPDALIVYPDNAVLGAIQAILESGRKDLALVFHRNVELSYFCALEAFYVDTRIADIANRLVNSILDKQEET